MIAFIIAAVSVLSSHEKAGMLLDPAVSPDKLQKLIEKTKQVAAEKGYKGGQHRLHYIAVGRAIQGE